MPMPTTRIEQATSDDDQRFDVTVVAADEPNGAAIVLYQEIFGVNDFLLGKATSLAELGYTVACPDVFWRVAPNLVLGHDDEALARGFEAVGAYAALDFETNLADLDAGLSLTRSLPEVTGSIAAMGYCLGGWLAYELAAVGEVDACVSYYGSAIPGRLEIADQITCPALLHFGRRDEYIPIEQAEAVRAAFDHRDDVEFHLHDAGHAFENLHASASADAEAAHRSWALTVDFLARALHAVR
jgi:carboxymethylenebutenolidase